MCVFLSRVRSEFIVFRKKFLIAGFGNISNDVPKYEDVSFFIKRATMIFLKHGWPCKISILVKKMSSNRQNYFHREYLKYLIICK